MMSIERELLKGAVEWMHELKYAWVEERDWGDRDLLYLVADIKRIEELLAQPEHTEQEPVAWMYEWHEGDTESTSTYCGSEKPFQEDEVKPFNLRPLYEHPKREPLSDDEIVLAYRELVKRAIGRFTKTKPAHGIGGGE